MHPYEPFVGVLLLPGHAAFARTAPVTLPDGQPVAQIRWPALSMTHRFDILDAFGDAELAVGRKGFWGRSYQITGLDGDVLLGLKPSWWFPIGRSVITLPGGQRLTTKGNWTGRRFKVRDGSGSPVARLATTNRAFSLRQDSVAFEMTAPVLSIVQAVGLAECVRVAVRAQQSSG